MKTSLVIMAAGIGSRFGGGIKQLEPVGVNGEIIMDYSIHDAIEAGFDKIIFIIRREIEADFKEVIGDRIEKICTEKNVEVAYAFQSLTDLPKGYEAPAERTKPWGTGQAVLAAKEIIKEPFAVINADDYYGREAFVKLHEFLTGKVTEFDYAMVGFILKNTLSENGGVTRGICSVDKSGYLTDVVETANIEKTENGAAVDGRPVDPDSYVSMNMWGLSPKFTEILEEGFREFLDTLENPMKGEFLIPIYIGKLLQQKKLTVKVLPTEDKWFGVTYREDKQLVMDSIRKLIADGVYAEDLHGFTKISKNG
ncbi:MAG: sugar phosphate nucleotidyltransferase [Eubacteriales bacterium]|nr:sugar phosphate nucleotidyltransferase [Eubacteriales bacterium]